MKLVQAVLKNIKLSCLLPFFETKYLNSSNVRADAKQEFISFPSDYFSPKVTTNSFYGLEKLHSKLFTL